MLYTDFSSQLHHRLCKQLLVLCLFRLDDRPIPCHLILAQNAPAQPLQLRRMSGSRISR